MTYRQALEDCQRLDRVLVPYENERGMEQTREALRSLRAGMTVGLIVGPEGGFSPEEIAACDVAPDLFTRISLGRRILRTETAGMASLAMLVYEWDQ